MDNHDLAIDPYLIKLAGTAEDNKQALADHIAKSHAPEPLKCLATTINKRDPMSAYSRPRSHLNYQTIDEVINHKPYHGKYPESFSEVPDYFKNSGISPYCEVSTVVDYSPGVMTIDLMIELTANNQPWSLKYEQDIYEILGIAQDYRKQLESTITEAKTTDNLRRKAYLAKLDKFIKLMEDAKYRCDRRHGRPGRVSNIFEVLKKLASLQG